MAAGTPTDVLTPADTPRHAVVHHPVHHAPPAHAAKLAAPSGGARGAPGQTR